MAARRTQSRPGRGRRRIGILIAALLAALAFWWSLPWLKSKAVAKANAVLAETFRGRVVIDGVDSLSLGGATGVRGRILGPAGHELAALEGAELRLAVVPLVVDALFGSDTLEVQIDALEINDAHVVLEQDQSGEFSIARAFEPATEPSTEPGRPVSVSISRIELKHVWLHGRVAPLGTLDADVSDVRASLAYSESGLRIPLRQAHVKIRALPELRRASGRLTGRFELDAKQRPLLSASYRGALAGTRLTADTSYSRGELRAELAAPRVEPPFLTALGVPIQGQGPLALQARLGGELPLVSYSVTIRRGKSTSWASGILETGSELRLETRAHTDEFDPKWFARDQEIGLVSAGVAAEVRLGRGLPRAEFFVTSDPTTVEGRPVPALSMSGVSRSSGVSAKIDVLDDPVLSGSVLLSLKTAHPERAALRALDFAVDLRSKQLGRSLGVAGLRGAAQMRGGGQLDLQAETVTAHFRADLSEVKSADLALRTARAEVDVDGSLQDPEIGVRVDGQELSALGDRFSQVHASASGRLSKLDTHARLRRSDGSELELSALISNGRRVQARGFRSEIRAAGELISLQARHLSFAGGKLELDGVELEGAGTLHASGSVSASEVDVTAHARDLDLAKLARVLRRPGWATRGKLSFDLGARINRHERRAVLELDLSDYARPRVETLNAALSASLVQSRLNLSASANLAHASRASLWADLRLPRTTGMPEPAELLQATGSARVKGGVLMQRICRLPLPLPAALVENDIQGALTINLEVDRAKPDEFLNTHAELSTQRLNVTVYGEPKANKTRKIWTLNQLDASAKLDFDANSQKTVADVTLLYRDSLLARANAKLTFPLRRLLVDPRRAMDEVVDEPLELQLEVPERRLRDLPELLQVPRMPGRVALAFELNGTLERPRAKLRGSLRRLRLERGKRRRTLDLELFSSYDGEQLEAKLTGASKGRKLLEVDAESELLLGKLLSGRPEFDASARLELDEFPLEAIPALRERRLAGDLSGSATLRDLGTESPELSARFEAAELVSGDVSFDKLQATLGVDRRRARANLVLRQSDGFAQAKFDTALNFAPPLDFEIDESKAGHGRLLANNFRAAALMPLVQGGLSELDGRVDADASVALKPNASTVEGFVRIREGRVQAPAIGQEFREVKATLVAKPGGVVELNDCSLRGRSGRARLDANARLNGLAVASAGAHLVIAKDEKLPVVIEGVSLGEAWGSVKAKLEVEPESKRLEASIDTESLHLLLPEQPPNGVQSLDSDPNVKVGVHRAQAGFVELPLQPLEDEAVEEPWSTRVRVTLGDDVWVEQGTQLEVKLGGAFVLESGPRARVSGQIQLQRGKLDVSGKIFEIEKGTITFQPDQPDNPVVVATARYESPEDITVFADFTGPVKSGELRLRSEPPLSQDQIVSLLLFGAPDGSFGAGGGGDNNAAQAASVGGGLATKGLNRSLARITDLDVSTRIDTSQAGNPRPELVVQLSARVSAQLGYNLSEPAPGKSPDRTLFTLEFRLFRRWSLATTFGDRGSSLVDLVWRYRY